MIGKVNRNGTFDVDYDDGEKEKGVKKDMMKLIKAAGVDLGGRRIIKKKAGGY